MLTLISGPSSIVVAPEHGASLIGWMFGTVPMLRRALPQAAATGDRHAMGCFPLLPYANRIAHSRFHWHGEEHRLQRNLGDHPHAIHGLGWQRPWTLEKISPNSITLSLEHRPDASWPFAFSAEIDYTLERSSLIVAVQLTNRHFADAPAGIGVHPFFPKAGSPSLRFNSSGAWENGADALPCRHGPTPLDWQHAEPRAVAGSRLDNCFTGWDGLAEIFAGHASLRIEASSVFRHLQVFTPSWADFFCAEPISHVPDAINRHDLPHGQSMHVLPPDQSLSGTVRFTPTG